MRIWRGGEGDRLTTRLVRTTRAGIGASSSFTLSRHMAVRDERCRLVYLSLGSPIRMPDNDSTRGVANARAANGREYRRR